MIYIRLAHFPASLAEETMFPPLYISASFVKDKVSIDVESYPSSGNRPTCRAAEIVDPLCGPNFSVLPQIDKWLQVALKDASSCYRQKKYAVAAGQFRTALEVWGKREHRWVTVSCERESCDYCEPL